jgi:hypothetical protein
VELSYIFSLLALTGISAPSAHSISRLKSISPRDVHKKNVDIAIQLLFLSTLPYDSQLEEKSIMTKCICQTVISSYWIQDGTIDQAWYYAEMANVNAEGIQLYDNNYTLSSELLYRREMLKVDLLFIGRFSSFVLSKPTSIPDIDCGMLCKPRRKDGSVDVFKTHLLQMKTSGPLLGLKIIEFVKRFNNFNDENERTRQALILNSKMDNLLMIQEEENMSLPKIGNVSVNESSSALLTVRKLSVTTSCNLMQILLALPFISSNKGESTTTTSLQKTGFNAAKNLLTSFELM